MQPMRILVPTDGSELAERAVGYAALLARQLDAGIDLCYAINYATVPEVLVASKAHGAPDLLRKDGQNSIESAIRILQPTHAAYQSHLIEGEPGKAILECARRIAADFIVLSTHGRSGIFRGLLGSTAEEVLRSSPIPLITLSPEFHRLQSESLTRILVAIDGSAPSRKAAEVTYLLAARCGAEVDLCYIIDQATVSTGMHDDAVAVATAVLEGESVLAAGMNVATAMHTIVIEGPTVASRLLDFATTHGAGLIAIGTHARSGIDRIVNGSVAEGVLRQSSLPVLITPAKSSISGS